MITRERLDAACRAYLDAQETWIRTPRHDVAYHLKAGHRDTAHDRLYDLLTLHGAVYHFDGLAWWIEAGELCKAPVIPYRRKEKKARTQ